MVRIKRALPAKLFVGLLTGLPEILAEVIEALVAKYGEVDSQSETFETLPPGDAPEGSLTRKFLSFDTLVDPGRLARIKRATDRMERELSPRRTRTRVVTLDPGMITSARETL